MKFIPISIRGRLLLIGLLLTGAALLTASITIDAVLDRFVRRSLNQSLDGQVGLLAMSVRADGTIDRTMLREIGPYSQYRRGWAWRIETPKQVYQSTEQIGKIDFHEEGDRGREGHFRAPPQVLLTGSAGDLYVRILKKDTPQGLVTITATAPHAVYERLRTAAVTPVLILLALLGVVLLAASWLQLSIGLRPLKQLEQALGRIRGGSIDRVPQEQPVELQPLTQELNQLLGENAESLARARGHVANLAHALKTPLATLAIKIEDTNTDPDGELGKLVDEIDRAIRHHLRRARAASPGAPGQLLTALEPAIVEILSALSRIHAERHLIFQTEVASGIGVKCDPQDLSEMLGNLLDNAAKWASTRVMVTAKEDGNRLRICIGDDGPGLGSEALSSALLPGGRLDEKEEGYGFGIPIARELAELYGGSLKFGASPLGGLEVCLILPR